MGVENAQSWGSRSLQVPPDPMRVAGECAYPAGGALSSPENQTDKWFSGGAGGWGRARGERRCGLGG